jgi:hypothetical protein
MLFEKKQKQKGLVELFQSSKFNQKIWLSFVKALFLSKTTVFYKTYEYIINLIFA